MMVLQPTIDDPDREGSRVVLAGNAADLARRATRGRSTGMGLPHLCDLFAPLVEHQVPLYV
jgi:hypothetical protein